MEARASAAIEEIVRGLPDDFFVCVWTDRGKRSAWCKTLDEIVAAAERLRNANVYLGVAATRWALSPEVRVSAERADALLGFVADIDVDHPVHRKAGLTGTTGEALEVFERLPLAPTLVVHSGHGIQGWWLFKEPWVFDSDRERRRAAGSFRAWGQEVVRLGLERGVKVDATFDLPRVMRLPGSRNVKAEPVDVRVLELSPERRYEPSEWVESGFVDWEEREGPAGAVVGAVASPRGIVLDPEACAPTDKLLALCENSVHFKRTWNRKRTDLDKVDGSASAYDMSLADQMAKAEWSEQEITNALIHWRRRQGEDLKLRDGYYKLTVGRALAKFGPAEQAPEEPDDKRGWLKKTLGVEVGRVARHAPLGKQWDVEVAGVAVGMSVLELQGQARFRAAVMGATRKLVPTMKPKQWDAVVQALLDVAEDIDGFGDTTVRDWLEQWWEDSGSLRVDEEESAPEGRARALAQGVPFADGRWLCFRSEAFHRYAAAAQGSKLSLQEILGVVSRLGGETRRVVRAGARTVRIARVPMAKEQGG